MDNIHIVPIPHTPSGLSTYLLPSKTIRLLSLQLSPTAFSSTYAREAAFADHVWKSRLENPLAQTFLAIDSSTSTSTSTFTTSPAPLSPSPSPSTSNENEIGGEITATATLLGPLPYPASAITASGTIPPIVTPESGPPSDGIAHFHIVAVFTLPKCRRRGISKAVMERVVRFAEEKAEGGRGVIVTVLVMKGNEAARRLYEGCGFVVRGGRVRKDEDDSNSEEGNVVLEYRR